MASEKTIAKRNQRAERKKQREELERVDLVEKEEVVPADGGDDVIPETVEKDYMMAMGPTSYEELEAAEEARDKAIQAQHELYKLQDLVYNIAYSALSPKEKEAAIVNVGKGFGKRLNAIAKGVVEKALDMDILQLKALIARDARHTNVIEKSADFLANTFGSPTEDSKPFIRKQLKTLADKLESGDESVRAEVPVILKSAKDVGIGGPESLLVEKDLLGGWRAVMWPTNNFKDRDGEILTEKAHLDYVDWVNKNMDCAPVFVVAHTPGTARESAVDFVAYENGFLMMSAPLTEKEASQILEAQTQFNIGLSHGTLVLERNWMNKEHIDGYIMVEVSDLPLERAANPFTDLDVVSKEAAMDEKTKQYLVSMVGEDRAATFLAKMKDKQDALRKEGVQEKEVKAKTESVAPPATPEPLNLDLLVKKIGEEYGMKELSDTIADLQEKAGKVEVLETLVKELMASDEDKLTKLIEPPIALNYSWQRPTQSKENVLEKEGKKEEDEKLLKAIPESGWLSEATGTQPVAINS